MPLVVGLLAACLAHAAVARASAVVGPGVREALADQGTARVLVAVERGGSQAEPPGLAVAKSVLERVGPRSFAIRRLFQHVSAFSVRLDAAGLAALRRHPRVLRIDLDEGGRGLLLESGPLAHFDQVHALGFQGLGARVAILDTGVHNAHPDLGGAIVDRACFCSGGDGCCPDGSTTQFGFGADQDDNGHGSNVAGVMISDGFVSPRGLAPDVELVSVKVLDSFATFCCSSDVVAGLDWVIANHPEVDAVNLSLGTTAIFPGDCDGATSFTMAYAEAIGTLRAMGIATVASSGNDGSGTSMSAPACVADAISVAAAWDSDVGPQVVLGCADLTTSADQLTCFSNTAATLDVVAAGNPMTSAGVFANTSTFIGTSNAAPLVTACIALMRSALPSLLSVDDVESALETSPVSVTDPTNGLSFPRIDCRRALQAAGYGGALPAAGMGLALVLAGAGFLSLVVLGRRR